MASIDQRILDELKIDGVEMGWFHQDRQKFITCGGCIEPFSLQYLPSLLECGHFICTVCYTTFKNICLYCNQKKVVKIANYKKLVESMLLPNKINKPNSKDKYSFSIKLNDIHGYTFTQIPGDITFQDLFCKIPQFEKFQEKMKDSIRIFINSAGSKYEEICHLKIGDYNGYLLGKSRMRGSLVSNDTKSNMITFHNRYLGGNSQE